MVNKKEILYGHPVLFKTRNRRFIYHLLWWFVKCFYRKDDQLWKFCRMMKETKMISFQLMQPKNPFKWFIRVMYHSNPSYSRKNLIIGDDGSFGLGILNPVHNFIFPFKDKLVMHQWRRKYEYIIYTLCNHCEKGKQREYYSSKYPTCINFDHGRNTVTCQKFKEIIRNV